MSLACEGGRVEYKTRGSALLAILAFDFAAANSTYKQRANLVTNGGMWVIEGGVDSSTGVLASSGWLSKPKF
jgi:hypothetical protein